METINNNFAIQFNRDQMRPFRWELLQFNKNDNKWYVIRRSGEKSVVIKLAHHYIKYNLDILKFRGRDK